MDKPYYAASCNRTYFRDYNPVIGRYVEADPIGLRGGINLYVYVRNRSINRIDPLGLMDIDPTGYYDSSNGSAVNIGIYGQVGIQGGVHLGLLGVNVSGGKIVGIGTSDSGSCTYITVCVKVGPGVYAGGGPVVGVGGYRGPIAQSGGPSIGVGGDVAVGFAGIGGQIGMGVGSDGVNAAGFAKGKGNYGAGFVVGVDFCWTELKCEKPKCKP